MIPLRAKWMMILVVVAVAGAMCVYAWRHTSQRNAQCMRNLERIAEALHAYTQNSKGEYYPPLSPVPGQLMFVRDAMHPADLPEATCLVSPYHADYANLRTLRNDPGSLIDDSSYWYLGYLFANERSALAWIDEYKKVLPAGQLPADVNEIWPEYMANFETRDKEVRARYEEARARYEDGLEHTDPRTIRMPSRAEPLLHEKHMFYALRQGVERFLITDIGNPAGEVVARSRIPVVVERPDLHGEGGHVLYMDGHVEFVPYPGPFPMTVAFIDGLRSLDRLPAR